MTKFSHQTKTIGTITFEVCDSLLSGIEISDSIGNNLAKNKIPDEFKPIIQKIESYLEGNKKSLPSLKTRLSGTEFQQLVWSEISRIPYGETRTYKEIANAINKPKAVRAVGTACGANKFAIIVPCHRVISSSGKLSGYRWGAEIKKKLLELEAK